MSKIIAALRLGRSVALIDMDPQLSLTDWAAARDGDELGLYQASAEEVARGDLRHLQVDYVLVDTPPSHDSENRVLAALRAADLALIPVRPSRLDLVAVARTAGLANKVRVPMRFVISQAGARSMLAAQAITVVSNHGPISGVIHSRQIFASSMTDGRTAIEVEPRGKAASEIETLWRNVEEALRNV